MQWHLKRLPDDTYLITLDDKMAWSNGSLVLTNPPFIPVPWTILRGAPSPLPVGENSFG